MRINSFRKLIRDFYGKKKRDLPWRRNVSPYAIVISEIMLQQTQVSRIENVFHKFLERFPDWKSLAEAPLAKVLQAWSGIGYNRRALYLKQIAQIVHVKYQDVLPEDPRIIDSFPGIGEATAGSIAAFAYNMPTVFIETNIRRVFIHHFFRDRENVGDAEILPLVDKTLDKRNPRQWYWALLDYGTYLVKTVENPNRRSRYYSVQSKFEGSNRQMRGMILHYLLKNRTVERNTLADNFVHDKDRFENALASLIKDGLVSESGGMVQIL